MAARWPRRAARRSIADHQVSVKLNRPTRTPMVASAGSHISRDVISELAWRVEPSYALPRHFYGQGVKRLILKGVRYAESSPHSFADFSAAYLH